MKVWVVLREAEAPDGGTCDELVGVFTNEGRADIAAAANPGTYLIAEVDADKLYLGKILTSQVRRVLGVCDAPTLTRQ